MQKQFSDKELDQLMRTLINDVSLDEGSIKDIADSPSIWWCVQRQINGQKASASSPWPPSVAIRRWLMIGVPSMAAAALLLAFFFMRAPVVRNEQVLGPTPTADAAIPTQLSSISPPEVKAEVISSSNIRVTEAKSIRSAATSRKDLQVARNTTSSTKNRTEIKTDYISLSYSGSPESGQVVRVKVPSSMMVTLGLVSSVEKPTSLVDADIVIGDDGQTHAIRFIR